MKSDKLEDSYFNGLTNANEEQLVIKEKSEAGDPFFEMIKTGHRFSERDPKLETLILEKIQKSTKKHHWRVYSMSFAAMVFLVLTSAWFIQKLNHEREAKLQVEALLSSPEKVQALKMGLSKLNGTLQVSSNTVTLNQIDKKINAVTSKVQDATGNVQPIMDIKKIRMKKIL